MPTSAIFLAIERAGLATFGLSSMMCEAEPDAAFEALGLEERVRVGERQHAPVELGAESVAGVEIEIAEADGLARAITSLKRLSLK